MPQVLGTSQALAIHDGAYIATADTEVLGERDLGNFSFGSANEDGVLERQTASAAMTEHVIASRQWIDMAWSHAVLAWAFVVEVVIFWYYAAFGFVDRAVGSTSVPGDAVALRGDLTLPKPARSLVAAVSLQPSLRKASCMATNKSHRFSLDPSTTWDGIASKTRQLSAAAFTKTWPTHRCIIRKVVI